MFSIISEVKYSMEKGRDFPPTSTEEAERVRMSRSSRQGHIRSGFPKFKEEYMSLSQDQRPIRFKDAVGRKFTFPFHLVASWAVRYTSTARGLI